MTIGADSSQAEEEFSKAQEVFEEINKELRDELPVLYQRLVQLYSQKFNLGCDYTLNVWFD